LKKLVFFSIMAGSEEFTRWDCDQEIFKYLRRVIALCNDPYTFEKRGLPAFLAFCRRVKERPPRDIRDRVFAHARSFVTLFLQGSGLAPSSVYQKFYEDFLATGYPFTKNQVKNINALIWRIKNPPKLKASPVIPLSLQNASASRRIRRAETVLQYRTSRIALVMDMTYNVHNQCAMLRSAELFGVQHVYVVLPLEVTNLKHHDKVSKGSERWLSIHTFQTSAECIRALRKDNREIWVADVGSEAEELLPSHFTMPFPERMAIVLGREATGPSKEMLDAADRTVYLPQYGFGDSFNVSVACALLLQFLYTWCPEARGQLDPGEREVLREQWYSKLASNAEMLAEFKRFLENPPDALTTLRTGGMQYALPSKIRSRIKWREQQLAAVKAREDDCKQRE